MRSTLLLLFLLPLLASAQTATLISRQKKCATYQVLENMRRQNPSLESDQQFETWLEQKKQARTFNTQSVVTLPVIFHIIHGPSEQVGVGSNVSQALIQQQILQLNKDFANQSNSPYAVAANTNIQFALAQKDPLGNNLPQPGIDRVDYTTAGFTAPPYTVGYASASNNYLNSTVKPNTIWDPSKYINIWILEMESGILGIATFPGSSGLSGLNNAETASTAGVAVGPETIGSIFAPQGCGAYSKGKTLTHELGHFFGLRHIWGDGPCANDYCGDTPVHASANSGVPTHPKANSCGTDDEMFENFMDYSDDVATNTFTADQVARMQTVLANSPRRNLLSASPAGLVVPTGSNRIAFYDCSGFLQVSESGTTGTSPRYRDYSFTLNVEDKATGNAAVTFNTSGTAINGFNYQVMTPTVNFVSGDNFKNVVVRVFDNAQVETGKSFTLTYSISGSGVQAGPLSQAMTISIVDDDTYTVSQTPYNLLTQDWETSSAGWSILRSSATFPNRYAIGFNGDAGGSGRAAYITDNTSTLTNTYTNTVAGLAVLRSPLIDATGLRDLQLTFKYKVWGEVYNGTPYDYGYMTFSTPAQPSSFADIVAPNAGPYVGFVGIVSGNPTINLPNSTFADKSFHLGWAWENDATVGNNPGLNIDDITLTGMGTAVETAVASSYGYDVQSGSGINNFKSTNGKAIARITNLSTNYSRITASVTAAGAGQVPIITSTGSFLRTQKVFQITPAVASATGSYQLTLYFTSSELAVWGGSKLNLKVLKVKDGVSLSGPINSSNAIAVTPQAVNEDPATGVITYTANFTDGFSQFVLVSSNFTLPVNLLTFDAQPAKRSIGLTWKTATERNNKGFHVERSTNGSDFTAIGWVKGAGSSDDVSAYTFTDNFVQPNTVYYYRLKQEDFDSRVQLSVIKQAKITENGLVVTVSPNPVKDQLRIFVSGSRQPSDVSLVNAEGKTVGRWKNANLASPYAVNVGRFARGHYTLVIHLADGDVSEQVILQ